MGFPRAAELVADHKRGDHSDYDCERDRGGDFLAVFVGFPPKPQAVNNFEAVAGAISGTGRGRARRNRCEYRVFRARRGDLRRSARRDPNGRIEWVLRAAKSARRRVKLLPAASGDAALDRLPIHTRSDNQKADATKKPQANAEMKVFTASVLRAGPSLPSQL